MSLRVLSRCFPPLRRSSLTVDWARCFGHLWVGGSAAPLEGLLSADPTTGASALHVSVTSAFTCEPLKRAMRLVDAAWRGEGGCEAELLGGRGHLLPDHCRRDDVVILALSGEIDVYVSASAEAGEVEAKAAIAGVHSTPLQVFPRIAFPNGHPYRLVAGRGAAFVPAGWVWRLRGGASVPSSSRRASAGPTRFHPDPPPPAPPPPPPPGVALVICLATQPDWHDLVEDAVHLGAAAVFRRLAAGMPARGEAGDDNGGGGDNDDNGDPTFGRRVFPHASSPSFFPPGALAAPSVRTADIDAARSPDALTAVLTSVLSSAARRAALAVASSPAVGRQLGLGAAHFDVHDHITAWLRRSLAACPGGGGGGFGCGDDADDSRLSLDGLLHASHAGLVVQRDFLPHQVALRLRDAVLSISEEEWQAATDEAGGYAGGGGGSGGGQGGGVGGAAATGHGGNTGGYAAPVARRAAHSFASSTFFPNSAAARSLLSSLWPARRGTFSASLYRGGDGIEAHDDEASRPFACGSEGSTHTRAVAVVLHLSEPSGWDARWGGEFVDLQPDGDFGDLLLARQQPRPGATPPRRYPPAFNTLVAFHTPRLHEVTRVARHAPPRVSLFGWFWDLECEDDGGDSRSDDGGDDNDDPYLSGRAGPEWIRDAPGGGGGGGGGGSGGGGRGGGGSSYGGASPHAPFPSPTGPAASLSRGAAGALDGLRALGGSGGGGGGGGSGLPPGPPPGPDAPTECPLCGRAFPQDMSLGARMQHASVCCL